MIWWGGKYGLDLSDKEVQSRTMSKKKTIRFSDELNEFLENHAKNNKRSFSKTVELFIELGREKESNH